MVHVQRGTQDVSGIRLNFLQRKVYTAEGNETRLPLITMDETAEFIWRQLWYENYKTLLCQKPNGDFYGLPVVNSKMLIKLCMPSQRFQ